MADKISDFKNQLAALKRRYGYEIQGKVDDILDSWAALKAHLSSEGIEEVHRKVHTLAGSGATFGFAEIGTAARAVEKIFKQVMQGERVLDDRLALELDQLFDTLNSIALAHSEQKPDLIEKPVFPEKQPRKRPVVNDFIQLEDNVHASAEKETPLLQDAQEIGELYLLCGSHCIRETAAAVHELELPVRHFQSAQELLDELANSLPIAVIVGSFDDDFSLVARYFRQDHTKVSLPPLFFVSNDDSFESRLRAVRSGATGFFTLPINVNQFFERIDTHFVNRENEPYRIVIVDDDPNISRHFEVVLRSRGWETLVVNNPYEAVGSIHEFQPDLILMDLYMPTLNGVELAAVLRQYEEYMSIPIVFLSIEQDTDIQLRAIGIGADDFLTKAMKPEHLIAAVDSRVRRYRKLRNLLTQDSLTGLLNHTNLKMRLDAELARSQRNGTITVFAMVDLDHFKKVNDTYGHPMGDQVIKSLAKLLRKRLRKSDVIGRYGGEEFGVILVDIKDDADAMRILDGLRESFSHIVFQHEDREFHVTLSCGVASSIKFNNVLSISDAADKALYEAKHQGRNKTVLA